MVLAYNIFSLVFCLLNMRPTPLSPFPSSNKHSNVHDINHQLEKPAKSSSEKKKMFYFDSFVIICVKIIMSKYEMCRVNLHVFRYWILKIICTRAFKIPFFPVYATSKKRNVSKQTTLSWPKNGIKTKRW